jgi:hypothetical protein
VGSLQAAATRGHVRTPFGGSDAGVVVVGTLAKLMILLAVLGSAGYDSLSLVAAHVSVGEDAQEAALIGHGILERSGTAQQAYAAILDYCDEHGDALVPGSFTVVVKNHAVSLTLRREAHTIVSSRVPRIKDYVVATSTATSKDPLT